jgi:hypothetical protein
LRLKDNKGGRRKSKREEGRKERKERRKKGRKGRKEQEEASIVGRGEGRKGGDLLPQPLACQGSRLAHSFAAPSSRNTSSS